MLDQKGEHMRKEPHPEEIDRYIASFPEPVAAYLSRLREIIREEAPDAIEIISYGMPTFHARTNLVHFAAAKHHIGFYPSPSGVEAFKEELGSYKTSKGAIRLPLDAPLPELLIRKIVRFRVAENSQG